MYIDKNKVMRSLRRLLLGLAILFHCACCRQKNVQDSTRPNVVFIITDDQRWDALSVAGNPSLRTPNIDRLASEGVLFERRQFHALFATEDQKEGMAAFVEKRKPQFRNK